MTSWNLISHVCETSKLVMVILHWKQGLLCDKLLVTYLLSISACLIMFSISLSVGDWPRDLITVPSSFALITLSLFLSKRLNASRYSRKQWINVTFLIFSPFTNKQWPLRVCRTNLKKKKNTVGKGEIARNEQFLLFPLCYLPVLRTFCHFHQVWNCRLHALWVSMSLKFVVREKANTSPSVSRINKRISIGQIALDDRN